MVREHGLAGEHPLEKAQPEGALGGRIGETLRLGAGGIFAIAWGLAGPATFIFLIAEDASRGVRGFWSWAACVIADVILAAIWPVYWLLLRWIL